MKKRCGNCSETKTPCACERNICKCGKPVWNITFTLCDKCWNIKYPRRAEKEVRGE